MYTSQKKRIAGPLSCIFHPTPAPHEADPLREFRMHFLGSILCRFGQCLAGWGCGFVGHLGVFLFLFLLMIFLGARTKNSILLVCVFTII
jgi:hypothetical protein